MAELPEVHICVEGQEIDNQGRIMGAKLGSPREKSRKIEFWSRTKTLAVDNCDLYEPGGKCIVATACVEIPRFVDGSEGHPRAKVELSFGSAGQTFGGRLRMNYHEFHKFREYMRSSPELDRVEEALKKETEFMRAEIQAKLERDRIFREQRDRRYAQQAAADNKGASTPKTGKTARKKKAKQATMAEPC